MTNTVYDGVSFANNQHQARLAVPDRSISVQDRPFADMFRPQQVTTSQSKANNKANINSADVTVKNTGANSNSTSVAKPQLNIKQKQYVSNISSVGMASSKQPLRSHGVMDIKPLKPVTKSATAKSQASQTSQATPKANASVQEIRRQAIMRQAALVRQQAKIRAEAAAKRAVEQQLSLTDMVANMSPSPAPAQAGKAPVSSMISPMVQANSTNTTIKNTTTEQVATSPTLTNIASDGAIAVEQPNFLQRLASAKITFSFKFNKQRILTVLRYLAVLVIIAASGYLAWDTYTTNQTVKDTFGGGSSVSAMSIAGVNPSNADQTAVSQEQKMAYVVPSDQPRMISIPAIGVNARVMSVGVNSQGNIDTPTNLNDTAWYDGSAKPGQDGQVFIDGHTSFSNSIYAAFNDLPKLKAGDKVTIEKGNGELVNYTVVAIETQDADKVDMGKALNPPEGAKKGLTLMTCTGEFDYRNQTANKRLIVYAVQEEA